MTLVLVFGFPVRGGQQVQILNIEIMHIYVANLGSEDCEKQAGYMESASCRVTYHGIDVTGIVIIFSSFIQHNSLTV